jgi:hypothetical protein
MGTALIFYYLRKIVIGSIASCVIKWPLVTGSDVDGGKGKCLPGKIDE